jgi:hypothetical protein
MTQIAQLRAGEQDDGHRPMRNVFVLTIDNPQFARAHDGVTKMVVHSEVAVARVVKAWLDVRVERAVATHPLDVAITTYYSHLAREHAAGTCHGQSNGCDFCGLPWPSGVAWPEPTASVEQ